MCIRDRVCVLSSSECGRRSRFGELVCCDDPNCRGKIADLTTQPKGTTTTAEPFEPMSTTNSGECVSVCVCVCVCVRE